MKVPAIAAVVYAWTYRLALFLTDNDIFEALPTLDAHQEGAGPGLAVSRELAHMLCGELNVVSELGVGSTLSLTLSFEPITPSSGAV